MPTYEFRCPKGHAFDRFFSKISDAPTEVPCPECGETAHVQISGGAGLVFKGSGFYLTDYGKNAHRGTAPKSGNESSGGASGGDSKPGSDSSSKSSESSSSTPAAKPDKPSPSTKSDSGKSSGGSDK